MSNVTVYLFLLENIPGFDNILTSSLTNFTNYQMSQCDVAKSNIIWEYNFNKTKKLNSLTNNYSDNRFFNDKYKENKVKIQYAHEFKKNYDISYNNEYPERPPFLVAIFESFFNITAQTCAGCLITSQYVLTASSCLHLLSYNIINSTDIHKTSYTIIANASNPLVDGTVHNVTEVILDKNNPTKFHQRTSNLALMKIEPAIKIKSLQIFKYKAKYGVHVRVYGWTVTKDHSGQDIMKAVSSGAKIVQNDKCKYTQHIHNEKHVICLMTESIKYFSQINSGGPVVLHHRGSLQLLSVADIRGTYVLVYSLRPYYNWIYNTIYSIN